MMKTSAHYLLSKHNNDPKALRCLAPFTDDCKAILQSDVLKDVGHLRNGHCQHCHRGDPCVLHSVQDCLTDNPAGTDIRPRGGNRARHQERPAQIILTAVKHSLVHNFLTDTNGTLARNTLKLQSKHNYFYFYLMSQNPTIVGFRPPEKVKYYCC